MASIAAPAAMRPRTVISRGRGPSPGSTSAMDRAMLRVLGSAPFFSSALTCSWIVIFETPKYWAISSRVGERPLSRMKSRMKVRTASCFSVRNMPRSAEEDGEEHEHHGADGHGFVAEDVADH